jgi:putative transposase
VPFSRFRTHVILTWMNAQRTKHATSKLAYHLVWCPKYCKRILTGKLAPFVEQELRRICEANTWTIGASPRTRRSCPSVSQCSPACCSLQIAHTLKGTTGRLVFQRFLRVKKQLWGGAFWPRSYSVGSVGDMSVDAVLTYIE